MFCAWLPWTRSQRLPDEDEAQDQLVSLGWLPTIDATSHVLQTLLHRLTERGATFLWDQACQTAFDTLKEQLTQAAILTYPKFLPSS